MGLEFNVELTYPIDQAIGTAMIFACGQIQAAIFILVSGALEQPLTTEAEKIQVQTVVSVDITLLDGDIFLEKCHPASFYLNISYF